MDERRTVQVDGGSKRTVLISRLDLLRASTESLRRLARYLGLVGVDGMERDELVSEIDWKLNPRISCGFY